MTDKQKRFADEYLIDCNATRAYKVAYPTVKNDYVASANGSRLLGNANVKKYIDEKMDKISSDKVATAEEVIEYLTSVLRGKSKDEKVVINALGEFERIEFCSQTNQIKAAELLGKRYNLFTDKVSMEGIVPIVIVGEDNLEE